MPTNPHVFGDDLVNVFKQKHDSNTYKSLVIYLDSCEAGSFFEGLLSEDLDIYAVTATNAYECNSVTYCPGVYPNPPPEEYDTCLGDLFSDAWMEGGSEAETLREQFELVKKKTSPWASHVKQYGNLNLNADNLSTYFGKNPRKATFSVSEVEEYERDALVVNQRDAALFYFWNKYLYTEDVDKKIKAERDFVDLMAHRIYLENSFEFIGMLLFGMKKGPEVLKTVRPSGNPLVDEDLPKNIGSDFRSSLWIFVPLRDEIYAVYCKYMQFRSACGPGVSSNNSDMCHISSKSMEFP